MVCRVILKALKICGRETIPVSAMGRGNRGRFVTTKRTADGGIDGRLYFGLPDSKELDSMIIEVKAGATWGSRKCASYGPSWILMTRC